MPPVKNHFSLSRLPHTLQQDLLCRGGVLLTKYAMMAALDYACIAYQQQPACTQPLFTIDNRETDVQCYIRRSRDRLIITFRGSNSPRDWRTNLMFCKKTVPYDNVSSKIRVHAGFVNAYKAPGVRDALHAFMDDGVCRVWVSGHSQGAALARFVRGGLTVQLSGKGL